MSALANPYLYRNAIRDPDMFFGRKTELAFVLNRLLAPQPQSTEIVGFRRIGKSSMLNAIERSIEAGTGSRIVVLTVDGSQFANGEVNDFFREMLQQLKARGLAIPKGTPGTYAGIRSILGTIDKVADLRIVVLIDEFEALTHNSQFPAEFFSFLRGIANNSPIAYVIASVDGIHRCDNKELAGSPFFNIFHTLNLGCLSYGEAVDLIRIPSTRAGFSLEPHLPRILQLAGLFPLFIQIACATFFEFSEQFGQNVKSFDWIVNRFQESVSVHFDHLWRHLSPEEQSVCRRRAIQEKIPEDSLYIVRKLVADGLLSGDLEDPCLFSPTFEMFIRKQGGNGNSLGRQPTDGPSELSENCGDGHTSKALATSMAKLAPQSGVVSVFQVKPGWPSSDGTQQYENTKRFRKFMSQALDEFPAFDQRIWENSAVIVHETSINAVNAAIMVLRFVVSENRKAEHGSQMQLRVGIAEGEYVNQSGIVTGTAPDWAAQICKSIDVSVGLAVSRGVPSSLERSLAGSFRLVHAADGQIERCVFIGAIVSDQDREGIRAHTGPDAIVRGGLVVAGILVIVVLAVIGLGHYLGPLFRSAITVTVVLFLLTISAVLLTIGKVSWSEFMRMVESVLPVIGRGMENDRSLKDLQKSTKSKKPKKL